MVRLIVLFLLVSLGAFVLAFQSSKPTPISIANGQISKRVNGSLSGPSSATFTISCKAGKTLVVNTTGTSTGFSTIATVKAPDGSMDGEKGVPNYAHQLTKTGTYTITVGANSMASTATKGSFLLEVVVY